MYTAPRNGRQYSAIGFRKVAPKTWVAAPGGYKPRMYSRPSAEWKFLDTILNGSVSTDGGQLLINGLAPGSSASQRVGMKVTIRSIELRGYITVTSTTGTDQIARLQVFCDHQANAANPTLGSQLLANNVLAPRSLASRKRFRIMWDRTFNLDASDEPGSKKTFRAYIKLRYPLTVEFNSGTAGTIADIVSNSLYFYTVGTNVAGDTQAIVYGYARIRYTDM